MQTSSGDMFEKKTENFLNTSKNKNPLFSTFVEAASHTSIECQLILTE